MKTLLLLAFLLSGSSARASQADYEEFLRGITRARADVLFLDEERLAAADEDGVPSGAAYGSVVLEIDPRYDGTVTHWSRDWSRRVVTPNGKALLVVSMGEVPQGWASGAGLRVGSQAACGEKTDAAGRYLESRRGTIRSIYANPLRALFALESGGRELHFSHCWSGFDSKDLRGKYRFVECSFEGSRQWSSSPEDPRFKTDYVMIEASTDYTQNPWNEKLELYRQNDAMSPIAPGWSLEHIGQGVVERRDSETGAVFGWHETHATPDGVYGVLAWDGENRATLRVSRDARGVRYEMSIKRAGDPESVERCLLRREP